MAVETKNLGLVKAIFVGTTPPTNTNVLWRDTSISPNAHKAFNTVTSLWEAISDVGTIQDLFDANTILKADTDNSPVAEVINEDTIVGRLTGDVIRSLTVSEARTLLGISFDLLTDTPSSKVGQALKGVRVNAGETALEFYTPSDISLYTDNGTLTGNRTVTMSGNTLEFGGGNVGIGVTPVNEVLELSGAVLIGASSGTVDGTIRWTGTDFEGRKSGVWVSMTVEADGDGVYSGSGTIPTTVTSTITDTWSLTGGNLGVGITPTVKLHTDGGDVKFQGVGIANLFLLDHSADFIGINTTGPSASEILRVNGDLYVDNSITAAVDITAVGDMVADNFTTFSTGAPIDVAVTIDVDNHVGAGVGLYRGGPLTHIGTYGAAKTGNILVSGLSVDDLQIRAQSTGQKIGISAGGTANSGVIIANSDVTFESGLNVGIGITPTLKFQVAGGDIQFRGATENNLFFLDHSADRIGFATAAPLSDFHFTGDRVTMNLTSPGGLSHSIISPNSFAFSQLTNTLGVILTLGINTLTGKLGTETAHDCDILTSNAARIRFKANGDMIIGGSALPATNPATVNIVTDTRVTAQTNFGTGPAANETMFVDTVNERVSVGTGTPTLARFQVDGKGTTDSTTAVLVLDSAASNMFEIFDDGVVVIGGPVGGVPGAILAVNSTTQGVALPRMTTTQRDAISTPATGLLIYNITTLQLEDYDGTVWAAV